MYDVMENEKRRQIEKQETEEDYYVEKFLWQPHISLLLMSITGILGYMICKHMRF
jgi:hypothetical protein